MSDINCRFILSVLRDFVNNKASVVDGGVDFDVVARLAKQQEIGGILYYQLHGSNIEVASLAGQYALAVHSYSRRVALYRRVVEQFRINNIPFVIFKGLEVASNYPVASLRTMGDLDFLVHVEDKERAHLIFEQLDLKRTVFGPNEWTYEYQGLEYELHHRLMNDEVGNYDSHKVFMEKRWDYVVRDDDGLCHFDWSYHFVFLILHLRKHFINRGVGVRYFLDLAFVIKKQELDWDFIKTELIKMDLFDFACICFSLIGEWFGVDCPYNTELDKDFVEQTINNIFNDGIFGFDSKDNDDNYLILQLNKEGNNKQTRIFKTIHNLFPGYKTLRDVPKYSFVTDRPYLVPVAWAYRFVSSIIEKRAKTNLKTASKSLSVDKDDVNRRIEFLKEWKLM